MKYYGTYEDARNLHIVMEFCKGGTLQNRLDEKTVFEEEESRLYFYQMLSSLNYLHIKKIVHRDIKTHNFIFEDDDKQGAKLKLIDFGMATKRVY